jgi:hypothetical protein
MVNTGQRSNGCFQCRARRVKVGRFSTFHSTNLSKEVVNKCIAPTARRTRCTWEIGDEDLNEAASLRVQVEKLANSPERNALICRFVLLHRCEKQHRDKLEADETGCLEVIVGRYGNEIPSATVECGKRESSTRTSQVQIKLAQTSDSKAEYRKQKLSARVAVRCQLTSKDQDPSVARKLILTV